MNNFKKVPFDEYILFAGSNLAMWSYSSLTDGYCSVGDIYKHFRKKLCEELLEELENNPRQLSDILKDLLSEEQEEC